MAKAILKALNYDFLVVANVYRPTLERAEDDAVEVIRLRKKLANAIVQRQWSVGNVARAIGPADRAVPHVGEHRAIS